MSLRDQLTYIYRSHGELTPEILVDEARPSDHPLHTRFEWDDSVAAERFRHSQAADIIRSVRVIYSEEPEVKSVRGFISVQRPSEANEHRRAYQPVEDAMSSDLTRRLVLAECEREWKSFKTKYEHLREFGDIIAGRTSGAA